MHSYILDLNNVYQCSGMNYSDCARETKKTEKKIYNWAFDLQTTKVAKPTKNLHECSIANTAL